MNIKLYWKQKHSLEILTRLYYVTVRCCIDFMTLLVSRVTYLTRLLYLILDGLRADEASVKYDSFRELYYLPDYCFTYVCWLFKLFVLVLISKCQSPRTRTYSAKEVPIEVYVYIWHQYRLSWIYFKIVLCQSGISIHPQLW